MLTHNGMCGIWLICYFMSSVTYMGHVFFIFLLSSNSSKLILHKTYGYECYVLKIWTIHDFSLLFRASIKILPKFGVFSEPKWVYEENSNFNAFYVNSIFNICLTNKKQKPANFTKI